MLFNGSNGPEKFELSANGQRLRFTRDAGNITMDTDGVETVQLNALGGADTVTQSDLTGTAVTTVEVDLGSGDGQSDLVAVNASEGADLVAVAGDATGVAVAGLAAQVTISHAEPDDRLTLDGLAGDDVIEAPGLAAEAISLTLVGGEGNDLLVGGSGDDVLLGAEGDDVLIGGPGLDVLDGGPGSNVLTQ